VAWDSGNATTFPGGTAGQPGDWDYTGREDWRLTVVAPDAPVVLFDARRDLDAILYPDRWSYVPFRTDVTTGRTPGALALQGIVESLDPDPHHFALRTFLGARASNRIGAVTGGDGRADGQRLRIRARAAGRDADRLEISLVIRDGSAWVPTVELTTEWRDLYDPVSSLRRTQLALLPRPYPQFLPYLFDAAVDAGSPDVDRIDGLQFAVDRRHFAGGAGDGMHGFEIERVVLLLSPEGT
jgi:hypothetical protein